MTNGDRPQDRLLGQRDGVRQPRGLEQALAQGTVPVQAGRELDDPPPDDATAVAVAREQAGRVQLAERRAALDVAADDVVAAPEVGQVVAFQPAGVREQMAERDGLGGLRVGDAEVREVAPPYGLVERRARARAAARPRRPSSPTRSGRANPRPQEAGPAVRDPCRCDGRLVGRGQSKHGSGHVMPGQRFPQAPLEAALERRKGKHASIIPAERLRRNATPGKVDRPDGKPSYASRRECPRPATGGVDRAARGAGRGRRGAAGIHAHGGCRGRDQSRDGLPGRARHDLPDRLDLEAVDDDARDAARRQRRRRARRAGAALPAASAAERSRRARCGHGAAPAEPHERDRRGPDALRRPRGRLRRALRRARRRAPAAARAGHAVLLLQHRHDPRGPSRRGHDRRDVRPGAGRTADRAARARAHGHAPRGRDPAVRRGRAHRQARPARPPGDAALDAAAGQRPGGRDDLHERARPADVRERPSGRGPQPHGRLDPLRRERCRHAGAPDLAPGLERRRRDGPRHRPGARLAARQPGRRARDRARRRQHRPVLPARWPCPSTASPSPS